MNIEMLRNYKNWEGKSPADIIAAVRKVGGWKKVFDDPRAFHKGLPIWAHRVRNYFNVEPITLTRLSEGYSGPLLRGMDIKMEKNANGLKEQVMRFFTLSGDVYRDNFNRIWYQMSSGGAIFHYGSDPTYPTLEAIGATAHGQRFTPVFKLVSPDRTDGSCETIIQNGIIRNWHVGYVAQTIGESNIGKVDVPEYVEHSILQDRWKQGSYNYAETAEVGHPAHEKYDVKPHEDYKFPGVYLNPPSRHALLQSRRFPINDEKGKPLANQIYKI